MTISILAKSYVQLFKIAEEAQTETEMTHLRAQESSILELLSELADQGNWEEIKDPIMLSNQIMKKKSMMTSGNCRPEIWSILRRFWKMGQMKMR